MISLKKYDLNFLNLKVISWYRLDFYEELWRKCSNLINQKFGKVWKVFGLFVNFIQNNFFWNHTKFKKVIILVPLIYIHIRTRFSMLKWLQRLTDNRPGEYNAIFTSKKYHLHERSSEVNNSFSKVIWHKMTSVPYYDLIGNHVN